jgi:hypothetical protein
LFLKTEDAVCHKEYGSKFLGYHVDPRFQACEAYSDVLYAGVAGPGRWYGGYERGHYAACLAREEGKVAACKVYATNMSKK